MKQWESVQISEELIKVLGFGKEGTIFSRLLAKHMQTELKTWEVLSAEKLGLLEQWGSVEISEELIKVLGFRKEGEYSNYQNTSKQTWKLEKFLMLRTVQWRSVHISWIINQGFGIQEGTIRHEITKQRFLAKPTLKGVEISIVPREREASLCEVFLHVGWHLIRKVGRSSGLEVTDDMLQLYAWTPERFSRNPQKINAGQSALVLASA